MKPPPTRTRFDIATWQLSASVFVLALTVRMGLVFYTGQYVDLQRYEMERMALSFARTGVLGNPYLLATGPSAHVCPGYAVFLGAVFWLFGTGIKAEIIKQLLASAAASLQYALLPLVAREFGMSSAAGVLSGLAGALLPLKFQTETMGDWEAPYVALMLIILLWRMRWTWRRGAFSLGEGLLQGFAWGGALLWSSSLLPVFGGLLVAGAIYFRKLCLGFYGRFMLIASLAALLVILPWGFRNYIQLGEFILTRSNFGLELKLSNNPQASSLELENKEHGLYNRFHPLQSRAESMRVQIMGEADYNRLQFREAVGWIRNNPKQFARLTAGRIWFFWFPRHDTPVKVGLLTILSFLTIPGLLILHSQDRASAWILGMALFLFPAVYYVIQVSVRYKYPVDWISLLLTANSLVFVIRRRHEMTAAPAASVPERISWPSAPAVPAPRARSSR